MPTIDAPTIAAALRAAGVPLFQDRRSDPKARAQDCLAGLTHCCDDSTLRFFHSRIVGSHECRSGLFFYIIESCALDPGNTRRGFRAVVFDVFGRTVYRPELENTHRTSDAARKAMWAWFDGFDEAAHYMAELERRATRLARESADLLAARRAIMGEVAA